jgi:putative endonuclease
MNTKGRQGEDLAASYLKRKGFTILARNYCSRLGEIDLVCRDRATIVFVEVKSKASADYSEPYQSVTARKRAKLRRLAELYLVTHRQENADARFDVLGITLGSKPQFEHLVGAF